MKKNIKNGYQINLNHLEKLMQLKINLDEYLKFSMENTEKKIIIKSKTKDNKNEDDQIYIKGTNLHLHE